MLHSAIFSTKKGKWNKNSIKGIKIKKMCNDPSKIFLSVPWVWLSNFDPSSANFKTNKKCHSFKRTQQLAKNIRQEIFDYLSEVFPN